MSKLIFIPALFSQYSSCHVVSTSLAAEIAQSKFDLWIEQQPVVYFDDKDSMEGGIFSVTTRLPNNRTHAARLVCIEELPKSPCAHQPEYSNKIPGWHHGPESEVECRICGVKLVASWEAV